MKSLLFIFLLFSHHAYGSKCVPIDKDFLSYYEIPADSPLLGIKTKISGGDTDKIICSGDSCGSGGCECALYVELDGCLTRVLEFRGSHNVLGENKDGMPAIQVKKRGGAIARDSSKTYVWDKDRRRYVEDKE